MSQSSTLMGFTSMTDVVDCYKKGEIGSECNHNMDDSPYMQRRLTINSNGDGADVPLLNNFDGYGPLMFEGADHCHTPISHHNKVAWRQLLAATTLCLIFMVVEVVGGYLAGSLAIMTDAAHLFSDFISFLVSLFAVWIGQQNPTKRLTYGYQRVEVLSALMSITVIWILTGVFIYIAILRIIHKDFQIDSDRMLFVSVFGIAVNILMVLMLHGGCRCSSFKHDHHSHHSLPDHDRDSSHNREERNINVRAAIIHVAGDFIQSVGVFISACVIKFYPEAKIADPICTFLFSIIVLVTTTTVFLDSIWVLMEGVPSHLDYTTISRALSALDGVENVHSLHVWSLTPGQYVVSTHLAVGSMMDRELVLERARNLLRLKFGLERSTIQVELFKPDTMLGCDQCRSLVT